MAELGGIVVCKSCPFVRCRKLIATKAEYKRSVGEPSRQAAPYGLSFFRLAGDDEFALLFIAWD